MHFFIIVYSILCCIFVIQFQNRQDAQGRAGLVTVTAIVVMIIFYLIISRPLIGDSERYYDYFLQIRSKNLGDALTLRGTDLLFVLMNWLVGQISSEAWVLFAAVLTVYFSVFILALHRYIDKVSVTVLLICYSAYPYFIAYGANGMRQGLAMAFLLMAYVNFRHDNRIAWAWLLMAPFWHSGAWLAVAVTIGHQLMCRLVRAESVRWIIVIGVFILAIGLSATGFNEVLMTKLSGFVTLQKSQEIYFSDEDVAYHSGFRIDFFFFSMFPLLSAWYFRRFGKTFAYNGSGWWLSLYLSLNIIYHLFSFAPFSDRFAAFSWILIPLLIFFQVRETKRRKWMAIFVICVVIVNIAMLQFYTGKFIGVSQG